MQPFSQAKGPIRRFFDMLLNDPAVGEAVTYRQFRGQSFSQREGRNVDTFEEFTVVGLKLRKVRRTAPTQQGSFEHGDQFFLFRIRDLPDGISERDRVIDSAGNTYGVVTPIDKVLGLVTTVPVNAS